MCHEEALDQIPWPVLHYQSTLDSAPPLPDKKRKSSTTSPVEESPPPPPPPPPPLPSPSPETKREKKTLKNVESTSSSSSSSSSSKESTPPSSLERLLLKNYDTDPTDEDSRPQPKCSSPKASNLVRKSSLLKIRSFFEKSHSEPRSDKKKKSSAANARKANSFRLREEPSRFYRSLDEEALSLGIHR